MAAKAWCLARQCDQLWNETGMSLKTKEEKLAASFLSPFPIRILDRWRRIGLVFWQQRQRYWTLERRVRVLKGDEPFAPLPLYQALEAGWRRRQFRLRPPSFWERPDLEKTMRRHMPPTRGGTRTRSVSSMVLDG